MKRENIGLNLFLGILVAFFLCCVQADAEGSSGLHEQIQTLQRVGVGCKNPPPPIIILQNFILSPGFGSSSSSTNSEHDYDYDTNIMDLINSMKLKINNFFSMSSQVEPQNQPIFIIQNYPYMMQANLGNPEPEELQTTHPLSGSNVADIAKAMKSSIVSTLIKTHAIDGTDISLETLNDVTKNYEDSIGSVLPVEASIQESSNPSVTVTGTNLEDSSGSVLPVQASIQESSNPSVAVTGSQLSMGPPVIAQDSNQIVSSPKDVVLPVTTTANKETLIEAEPNFSEAVLPVENKIATASLVPLGTGTPEVPELQADPSNEMSAVGLVEAPIQSEGSPSKGAAVPAHTATAQNPLPNQVVSSLDAVASAETNDGTQAQPVSFVDATVQADTEVPHEDEDASNVGEIETKNNEPSIQSQFVSDIGPAVPVETSLLGEAGSSIVPVLPTETINDEAYIQPQHVSLADTAAPFETSLLGEAGSSIVPVLPTETINDEANIQPQHVSLADTPVPVEPVSAEANLQSEAGSNMDTVFPVEITNNKPSIQSASNVGAAVPAETTTAEAPLQSDTGSNIDLVLPTLNVEAFTQDQPVSSMDYVAPAETTDPEASLQGEVVSNGGVILPTVNDEASIQSQPNASTDESVPAETTDPEASLQGEVVSNGGVILPTANDEASIQAQPNASTDESVPTETTSPEAPLQGEADSSVLPIIPVKTTSAEAFLEGEGSSVAPVLTAEKVNAQAGSILDTGTELPLEASSSDSPTASISSSPSATETVGADGPGGVQASSESTQPGGWGLLDSLWSSFQPVSESDASGPALSEVTETLDDVQLNSSSEDTTVTNPSETEADAESNVVPEMSGSDTDTLTTDGLNNTETTGEAESNVVPEMSGSDTDTLTTDGLNNTETTGEAESTVDAMLNGMKSTDQGLTGGFSSLTGMSLGLGSLNSLQKQQQEKSPAILLIPGYVYGSRKVISSTSQAVTSQNQANSMMSFISKYLSSNPSSNDFKFPSTQLILPGDGGKGSNSFVPITIPSRKSTSYGLITTQAELNKNIAFTPFNIDKPSYSKLSQLLLRTA